MTTATRAKVLARFFRVLGNPTRLVLIQELESGEQTVGQLVAAVGQPQPRVSTHLACLRHCGFAVAERRGKEVVYRLVVGLQDLLAEGDRRADPLAERLSSCSRIGPDWM
ncbi:metalloregulator ArsR/SmtB family transcription factor [Candidatus Nephthysia bennettiae]|uniref:Winged helix-turn-helix transcriptional regulator n=1 Tax=Candidatus Nephthysia bennettiae TaxID=3127016 RepID=A0A934N8U1_9BACT|nr:winged helix-turn-helix transcriptional regulator [Candidatus Dormibacteraeota bacterium]